MLPLLLGLILLSSSVQPNPRPQTGTTPVEDATSGEENSLGEKATSEEDTTLKDQIASKKVELKDSSEKVCLTPGCVTAAAEIISQIDTTVDPCTDFYEFACGGFLKEAVIADHETSKGSFSIARDKLNERLRLIFESEDLPDEPKSYHSVRSVYRSCMDEDLIEKSSKDDLLAVVAELGGWPLLEGDKWSDEGFLWYKVTEKANHLGMDTDKILSLGISTNKKNSTARMFEVDQPGLGFSREYLIKGKDDKDVKAYFKYMVDSAVHLGADPEAAAREMEAVLDFELKLANMTAPKEERRNKTAQYNPIPLSQLETLWPGIDWMAHINILLENPEVTVSLNETINVGNPKFVKTVAEFLPTIPARVQANYLLWRYVKGLLAYTDSTALEIQLNFNRAITGKGENSPRWEKCVKFAAGIDGTSFYFYEGSLTNAVGAMYAKKHFPLEKKRVADEMTINIRDEFKIMLTEIDWMDNKTKSKALEKAEKMENHLGYADEILDDALIEEFYQGLDLSSKSFLTNYLDLKKFIGKYYVNEFRKPIDNKSWKKHGGAAVVNAFYNSAENSIKFPAGILEGVFFKADRPDYMNYAAIGMVIGHEITHGFDDTGSQKDGDGNLKDWWEPGTKQKYVERAQCIIDQYSDYSIEVEGENIHLNGINTQGENIADNGGMKEALRAYNRLVETNGEKFGTLPGLPYNQKQVFWIANSAVWCNKKRPLSLKNLILTDTHSPSRFRVNGVYANMEEFARDWSCPKDSPMNPGKRCVVW